MMAEVSKTAPLGRARHRRRPARRVPGQGYTRFVTVMKVLLPLLAAGLVVLLAVWSQLSLDTSRFHLDATELAPDQLESLKMVNARFDGIDEKNRPYSVTAEQVVQDREDSDKVALEHPKADMTLDTTGKTPNQSLIDILAYIGDPA